MVAAMRAAVRTGSTRRHVAVAIAALGCALAGPAAPAAAQPAGNVMQAVDGRGSVDWTRGLITAAGAAPGDIRAPSPDLARVGAARRARAQARARLLALARALALAGGGTVGERADVDPSVAARLARAVERALDLTVDYGSDGSVVLAAGLPLEAVRQAVQGVAAQELAGLAAPGRAPTAVIVDARAVLDAPALGLALRAGAETYAGPVVFHRKPGRAAADPRRGARPVRTRARALGHGALSVRLSGKALVAARSARALVIVIIGRP